MIGNEVLTVTSYNFSCFSVDKVFHFSFLDFLSGLERSSAGPGVADAEGGFVGVAF